MEPVGGKLTPLSPNLRSKLNFSCFALVRIFHIFAVLSAWRAPGVKKMNFDFFSKQRPGHQHGYPNLPPPPFCPPPILKQI